MNCWVQIPIIPHETVVRLAEEMNWKLEQHPQNFVDGWVWICLFYMNFIITSVIFEEKHGRISVDKFDNKIYRRNKILEHIRIFRGMWTVIDQTAD